MIVIKIKQLPTSNEGLKERVRRAWKITPKRLQNQEHVIAVFRGEIVGEYKLLGYEQDTLQPDRVAFELSEISGSLKGKRIHYKTPNPCTIVDEQNLVLS